MVDIYNSYTEEAEKHTYSSPYYDDDVKNILTLLGSANLPGEHLILNRIQQRQLQNLQTYPRVLNQ